MAVSDGKDIDFILCWVWFEELPKI